MKSLEEVLKYSTYQICKEKDILIEEYLDYQTSLKRAEELSKEHPCISLLAIDKEGYIDVLKRFEHPLSDKKEMFLKEYLEEIK